MRTTEHKRTRPSTAEVFTGTTLGEIYGEGKTGIFQHPSYLPAEEIELSGHPWFYRYRAGTDHPLARRLSQEAQATRMQAVAAGLDTLLLPRSACIPELCAYLRSMFGETSASNIEYYEDQAGLQSRLQQLQEPHHSVVVPTHPLVGTPEEIYYVHPDTIANLNRKDKIQSLTEHVPEQFISDVGLLKVHLRKHDLAHAYIKEMTGSGGDTVVPIQGPFVGSLQWVKSIERAQEKFRKNGARQVLIEVPFEYDDNYGVQMQADSDGNIRFVHISLQRIENGIHLGNEIDLEATINDVPDAVLRVARQAMHCATKRGWYGIVGLDILHRRAANGGVAMLIDPNFRVTSATTISLIRRTIRESTGNRFASSVSLKPKGNLSFEEAFRGARALLDNGDVIIVGGAKLECHSKLYGAVLGNNSAQIARARESLGDYYEVV